MTDISNSEDVLDVRDVIARFEELETELTDAHEGEGNGGELAAWIKEAETNDEHTLQEAAAEYRALSEFLEELRGNGGDEQWRGDWYPVTLIRETYFKDYAQELAEELELIPSDAKWPANCIDWEQAARELKYDYTGSDFSGVTYYHR